jgi:hypothetical protein
MKASRNLLALGLAGVWVFAAPALCKDHKALPSCAELEGRTITLRGKVSEEWDNMDPDTDFGEGGELVLDPMETVLLVKLRRPICTAPEHSAQNRPVVQSEVTIVEIVLSGSTGAEERRSYVGKVRTIAGTLSENVWWHYSATMRIAATSIR